MEHRAERMALKMAGFDLEESQRLIDGLSERTLQRLTRAGFDRRLIMPVVDHANAMSQGLDQAINMILDDQSFIAGLLASLPK